MATKTSNKAPSTDYSSKSIRKEFSPNKKKLSEEQFDKRAAPSSEPYKKPKTNLKNYLMNVEPFDDFEEDEDWF